MKTLDHECYYCGLKIKGLPGIQIGSAFTGLPKAVPVYAHHECFGQRKPSAEDAEQTKEDNIIYPEDDPLNYTECPRCNGLGQNSELEPPCDKCKGLGKIYIGKLIFEE